ncbi:MAG: hypothetical protein ACYDEX_06300 [Mobilitalea sp.]
MYISSTNYYLGLPESNIPTSLIASEKYYNCENFFSNINQKKKKLFQKNILSKKR